MITDESADIFTNIETEVSWPGESTINWFEFVADGVQPDTSSPAHVVVRYTPSDANVGTAEFNFYVEYNDIVPVEEGILVEFADSVLAPGDTTQIILRRQNSDGTIENFSPYDGFEIGMIEGCEAGQILTGGVLAPYFEEAYQPIYFVADGNLTETDTVKIRVGLIEGIIGSSNPIVSGGDKTESKAIDSKNKITKRKFDKNIKEPEPPKMNPGTYCFLESLWTLNSLESFGFVVVGDGCDFENCDWNYEDVVVILERQFNNYEQQPNSFEQVCLTENDPSNPNETHLAQSHPLDYFRQRKNSSGIWENSWEVRPCLDNDGNVRFKILTHDLTQPANIYVDFISDICYNFINPDPDDDNLLTSHTQLASISNPNQVMDDLCGHYEYPQRLSKGAKIIKSVLERHEDIHKEAYQAIVDRRIINFLIPKLNEQIYACEVYKVVFTKSEDIEREIFSAIRQFVLECKDDYERESFVGDYYDETEHYNYEENIQCDDSITDIIEEYITWLNRYQHITIPTFCNTCLN